MTFFLDYVHPHILVALLIGMIGLLLELIDAYRLPRTYDDGFSILYHLTSKKDEDEIEISERDRKERFADKVQLLRARVTVFSILFSIFGMNVEVLAHLVFDATLSWTQNAMITVGPVAFLSYAMENLIKPAFDD